jgi:hypothetical protein
MGIDFDEGESISVQVGQHIWSSSSHSNVDDRYLELSPALLSIRRSRRHDPNTSEIKDNIRYTVEAICQVGSFCLSFRCSPRYLVHGSAIISWRTRIVFIVRGAPYSQMVIPSCSSIVLIHRAPSIVLIPPCSFHHSSKCHEQQWSSSTYYFLTYRSPFAGFLCQCRLNVSDEGLATIGSHFPCATFRSCVSDAIFPRNIPTNSSFLGKSCVG